MLFGGLMAMVLALWSLGLTRLDDEGRPTSFEDLFLTANLLAMCSAQVWLGWKLVRCLARSKTSGQTVGSRRRDAEHLGAGHAVEEPEGRRPSVRTFDPLFATLMWHSWRSR
jgi:hypothetical protein